MVIYIWIIGACEDWSESMYVISYMFWFNNYRVWPAWLNLWPMGLRLELDFGLIPNVNHAIHFVMSFPWLVIDSMVLRNLLFLNLWLPLPTACSSFVRPCCCFWKFLSTMLGSPKSAEVLAHIWMPCWN